MKKFYLIPLLLLIIHTINAQEPTSKKKDQSVFSYEVNGDVLMHHFDIRNNRIIEKNWLADKFQFSDRAKIIIPKGDDKGEYQILKLLKFLSTYTLDSFDVNEEKRNKLKSKEKEKSDAKIVEYKTEMDKFVSAVSFPVERDEKVISNYVLLKEKIKSDYKKKIAKEKERLTRFNDSIDKVLRKTPKEITITKRNRMGKIIRDPKISKYRKKYINIDDQDKLYAIKTSDFNSLIENGYIRKRYRTNYHLAYGATFTVPFKIRPEVNDENLRITPEISLGGFLGGKVRINKYKDYFLFLPVLTAGITTININEDNVSMDMEDQEDGLVLARTFSLGAVLELNKFQVGAVIGWDRPGGEIAKDWIYSDRLWYSLSIGFDFFSRSTDKKDENNSVNE